MSNWIEQKMNDYKNRHPEYMGYNITAHFQVSSNAFIGTIEKCKGREIIETLCVFKTKEEFLRYVENE